MNHEQRVTAGLLLAHLHLDGWCAVGGARAEAVDEDVSPDEDGIVFPPRARTHFSERAFNRITAKNQSRVKLNEIEFIYRTCDEASNYQQTNKFIKSDLSWQSRVRRRKEKT